MLLRNVYLQYKVTKALAHFEKYTYEICSLIISRNFALVLD